MFYAIIIIHQIRVDLGLWDKSLDFRDNLSVIDQIIPKIDRFIPKFDIKDIL